MKPTPDPTPEPRLALTLTPAQQRNLLGFLQRVNLTGREVPAWNELFSLVRSAARPPQPDNPAAGRSETAPI